MEWKNQITIKEIMEMKWKGKQQKNLFHGAVPLRPYPPPLELKAVGTSPSEKKISG